MSTPSLVERPLRPIGSFFAMTLDTARGMVRRPFQVREFLEQMLFIVKVSLVPTVMLTVPFCGIAVFLINQLLAEIGATDLSGAGAGLAVITNIGPLCSVLVVAGAGATAVCADLGARTIREEIAAMEVLGIDPVQRLVVPRVLAMALTALCLTGVVTVVGLAASYFFSVLLQDASPGQFLANITLVVGTVDYLAALVKAIVFGLAAGMVACYRGLTVSGGPKGVGDAVNQTVVLSFVLLFVLNTLISSVYLQFT